MKPMDANNKTPVNGATKIVEYNFTPEILSRINLSISPSIWRIISDYAETIKNITFELWGVNTFRFGDEYIRGDYCDWHGQYTFGTCWSQGCKIRLTPQAGILFELKKLPPMPPDHIATTIENFKLQYRNHRNNLAINPTNRDYNIPPFYENCFTDVTRNLSNKILDHVTSNNHDFIVDSLIMSYVELKKRHNFVKLYLHIINSGDKYADVALIYKYKEICEELEWIQRIGENNHSIQFV